MSITEQQMLAFVDELEKRVQERDSSFTVKLQSAIGIRGTVYIVNIENAMSSDQYHVDSYAKEYIRTYNGA